MRTIIANVPQIHHIFQDFDLKLTFPTGGDPYFDAVSASTLISKDIFNVEQLPATMPPQGPPEDYQRQQPQQQQQQQQQPQAHAPAVGILPRRTRNGIRVESCMEDLIARLGPIPNQEIRQLLLRLFNENGLWLAFAKWLRRHRKYI